MFQHAHQSTKCDRQAARSLHETDPHENHRRCRKVDVHTHVKAESHKIVQCHEAVALFFSWRGSVPPETEKVDCLCDIRCATAVEPEPQLETCLVLVEFTRNYYGLEQGFRRPLTGNSFLTCAFGSNGEMTDACFTLVNSKFWRQQKHFCVRCTK